MAGVLREDQPKGGSGGGGESDEAKIAVNDKNPNRNVKNGIKRLLNKQAQWVKFTPLDTE